MAELLCFIGSIQDIAEAPKEIKKKKTEEWLGFRTGITDETGLGMSWDLYEI